MVRLTFSENRRRRECDESSNHVNGSWLRSARDIADVLRANLHLFLITIRSQTQKYVFFSAAICRFATQMGKGESLKRKIRIPSKCHLLQINWIENTKSLIVRPSISHVSSLWLYILFIYQSSLSVIWRHSNIERALAMHFHIISIKRLHCSLNTISCSTLMDSVYRSLSSSSSDNDNDNDGTWWLIWETVSPKEEGHRVLETSRERAVTTDKRKFGKTIPMTVIFFVIAAFFHFFFFSLLWLLLLW